MAFGVFYLSEIQLLLLHWLWFRLQDLVPALALSGPQGDLVQILEIVFGD